MNVTRLSDSSDQTPGQKMLELPARLPQLDVARGVDLMGSDQALAEILDTVNTSLITGIPDIWNALKADDVALANRLLHGIKGYAPIFCSDALINQVTQVELISKTESSAIVTPMFAELAPRLEALLIEIQTYVGQGK